jgi:chromodomain-helicase-DNA-binding protein 7
LNLKSHSNLMEGADPAPESPAEGTDADKSLAEEESIPAGESPAEGTDADESLAEEEANPAGESPAGQDEMAAYEVGNKVVALDENFKFEGTVKEIKQSLYGKREYKVNFKGYSKSEAKWMDSSVLEDQNKETLRKMKSWNAQKSKQKVLVGEEITMLWKESEEDVGTWCSAFVSLERINKETGVLEHEVTYLPKEKSGSDEESDGEPQEESSEWVNFDAEGEDKVEFRKNGDERKASKIDGGSGRRTRGSRATRQSYAEVDEDDENEIASSDYEEEDDGRKSRRKAKKRSAKKERDDGAMLPFMKKDGESTDAFESFDKSRESSRKERKERKKSANENRPTRSSTRRSSRRSRSSHNYAEDSDDKDSEDGEDEDRDEYSGGGEDSEESDSEENVTEDSDSEEELAEDSDEDWDSKKKKKSKRGSKKKAKRGAIKKYAKHGVKVKGDIAAQRSRQRKQRVQQQRQERERKRKGRGGGSNGGNGNSSDDSDFEAATIDFERTSKSAKKSARGRGRGANGDDEEKGGGSCYKEVDTSDEEDYMFTQGQAGEEPQEDECMATEEGADAHIAVEKHDAFGEVAEDEALRVEKILAVRALSARKWQQLCAGMHTQHVTNGSMFIQELPEQTGAMTSTTCAMASPIKTTPSKASAAAMSTPYPATVPTTPATGVTSERFLIKWADHSFLHISWETEADLVGETVNGKTMLQRFKARVDQAKMGRGHGGAAEEALLAGEIDEDLMGPEFTMVERVVKTRTKEENGEENGDDAEAGGDAADDAAGDADAADDADATADAIDAMTDDVDTKDQCAGQSSATEVAVRELLVKWRGLGYEQCTWEVDADLGIMPEDESAGGEGEKNGSATKSDAAIALRRHLQWEATTALQLREQLSNKTGAAPSAAVPERCPRSFKPYEKSPVYRNGGELRSYQLEALNWLTFNWLNNRNSLLADEMGLGKTIQTAAFINHLATKQGVKGPFLIVAPLSTLPHWQREFAGWTELNTLVYHGSKEGRRILREHEFYRVGEDEDEEAAAVADEATGGDTGGAAESAEGAGNEKDAAVKDGAEDAVGVGTAGADADMADASKVGDSKDKPEEDSKDKPEEDSKDKPEEDSKDKPEEDSKDKPEEDEDDDLAPRRSGRARKLNNRKIVDDDEDEENDNQTDGADDKAEGDKSKRVRKFDVLITSYENVHGEEAIEHLGTLSGINWSLLVVDEAQRLKNATSRVSEALAGEFDFLDCLLLTGTPIQNNIEELWALLNFLAPEQFCDRERFLKRYKRLSKAGEAEEAEAEKKPEEEKEGAGGKSSKGDGQLQGVLSGMHEELRPYMLRRMKEHVEVRCTLHLSPLSTPCLTHSAAFAPIVPLSPTSSTRCLSHLPLPLASRSASSLKVLRPKEETIVEVDLTIEQKQVYRAVYEKNFQFLQRGVDAKGGPSLNNICMELRKCCNHPFLIDGVEDRAADEHEAALLAEGKTGETTTFVKLLTEASGKMIVLDKLLPRLRAGGHRVLIFSQFSMMLDLLSDYLEAKRFPFEMITGSVSGAKRQRAIDRFSRPDSDCFVMLLTTKAGGVGINLTAADTAIIYDSDWNPQNDMQAMARCHRIGQTKQVKIFRLLTNRTYEHQVRQIIRYTHTIHTIHYEHQVRHTHTYYTHYAHYTL